MVKYCYRGQIYFAPLPVGLGSIQGGRRPVIIVSNNIGNTNSSVVVVVPITTRMKPRLPTHFELSNCCISGTVLCEQIQTIEKNSLCSFVTCLDATNLECLDKALSNALDLEGKYARYRHPADSLQMYDTKMIDEQISKCKEMQDDFTFEIDRLAKMLHQPTMGLRMWERQKRLPPTVPPENIGNKRKYIKRSVEETESFIKDWEDGHSSRQDVAEAYGFSSRATAAAFYARWKNRIKEII